MIRVKMRMLEEAAEKPELLTPEMVRELVATCGIGTDQDESIVFIREDRDAR
jgi:hypothetical protein